MRHLHENPYGFSFETELYPALMQGVDCPSSIIAALDSINDSQEIYDVVLILRGGGAKLDLACYDDYDLAAVIAQYPLPVITAIGHDQDYHVCDMVAHEYLKTPTALADFILEIYEDEDARLSSFATRMKIAFTGRMAAMDAALVNLQGRIRNGAVMKLSLCESKVELLRTRIESSDPRKILERGYALATDADGVVMKGVVNRSKGDKVSVVFADGTIDCIVENVRLSS
jgi:exodeoxyribonuclease VII large subunit